MGDSPERRTQRRAPLSATISRLLARVSSTPGDPHHASFLADIDDHTSQFDACLERRALRQHLAAAVDRPGPNAFTIGLASIVVMGTLALSVLRPDLGPVVYGRPNLARVASALHIVGLAGILVYVVGPERLRHPKAVFVFGAMATTAIAAIANLFVHAVDVGPMVRAGDTLAVVAEVPVLVGTAIATAAIVRGAARWFRRGWRTVAVGAVMTSAAQMVIGLGAAASDGAATIVGSGASAGGLALLGATMLRYTPPMPGAVDPDR